MGGASCLDAVAFVLAILLTAGDLGLAGAVRCLVLLDVAVRLERFNVVAAESVVFWLFKELLDEVAELCRTRPGDGDLDDGCPPLLFRSATRLFLITKGVVADVVVDLSAFFLMLSGLLFTPLPPLTVDLLIGIADLLLELDGRFLSVYGDRLGVECLSWCGDIASRRP